MADFVSKLGGFIIIGILILAGFKLFFWLLDEGYLKYLLIGAALVGLFLWKTGRWEPGFLPQQEESGLREVYVPETAPAETQKSEDESYRPAWNKGACRSLGEDVHVVVIFLDDADSTWYEYTFNWLLRNKLEPGMKLIRKQAENYGYSLNMDYTIYKDVTVNYSVPDPYQDSAVYRELPEVVAQAMGFSSSADMLDYHRDYFGMEQIAYFFCTNKHGRSYALPSRSSARDDVEYCVFFTLYDNGWATSHATVPHEILHLFGAVDMYAEDDVRVGRQNLARKLCPDDLMLGDEHNTPVVDRFTAYTIGWLDEIPAEYNVSDWWS